jgi:hypothetical protein
VLAVSCFVASSVVSSVAPLYGPTNLKVGKVQAMRLHVPRIPN